MHTRIKQEIISLAKGNPSEEVCGFIYHDGKHAHLMPCQNIATDPTIEFEISTADQMRFEEMNAPLGVYHSHPKAGAFSPDDLLYAGEVNLPQYVYDVAGDEWHEFTPMSYSIHIEERPFVMGFHDCYGLLRDYARQSLHHCMRDYDRDESMSHEKAGTIMANYVNEGYEQIELSQVAPGNVLMFKTDLALPQHFAILHEGNRMLHHPLDALCRLEPITGRWLSRLTGCFRLKK